MNAKNLWLRFAFVAVLVALCLLPLMAGRGLRWGIDLQGGTSLIFEFKGDPDDRAQLISRLKRRVDPNGLLSLEWRPLRGNRFEVRMPAGKSGARDKRDAYFEAMDRLDETNIQPAEIRDVLQSPPDARTAKIESYTGGDKERTEEFLKLASAYDALQGAIAERDAARRKVNEALAQAEPPADLDELTAAASTAADTVADDQVAFDAARNALDATNVNRQELHLILENYFRSELASKTGAAGAAAPERVRQFANNLVIQEISTGAGAMETSLEDFEGRYPARKTEIEHIVSLFQDWVKVRQRLDDPADLIRLIRKAGVLEFRVAPLMPGSGGDPAVTLSEEDVSRYIESLKTEGPGGLEARNSDFRWFPIRGTDVEGMQRYILLYNKLGYTMLHENRGAWELTRATPTTDQNGRPAVDFTLNEAGAGRMAKLTAANIDHPMAILLDDEVYSAPTIRSTISNQGQITGVERAEVPDLVSTLNAGSLPAKLNPDPVSENSFGPAIGAVNRDRGYAAAKWGLVAVAAFMFAYYLLGGAIADLALVMNVILVLGAMSWFGAVFTLPGIAGVVLTIGIAVDANVLIFERLREEQAKGQSVRMALKNAYERAFSAIFDANITTLLTCLILGWVGTEEVRGFAITLGLGVTFSLFTALVVTRWVFQLLLDLRMIKNPLYMLRLIGVPNVNWMAKRHLFWGLSLAFMVLGVVSVVQQGQNIWGIEFSQGTQMTITFKDDALVTDPDGKKVLPNDAVVREQFRQAAGKLGYDKLQATASVETLLNPDQVRQFMSAYGQGGFIALAEWGSKGMSGEFFKDIDLNGDGRVSSDELKAMLPPLSYQVSTTETDVEKLREVARDAFGDALAVSPARQYHMLQAEASELLGLTIPADRALRITDSVEKLAASGFRGELADETGGALMVVKDVDPPITREELTQRIRNERSQPDYQGQIFTTVKVIGLEPAGGTELTSFAVVATPPDEQAVRSAESWSEFVRNEADLLAKALSRAATMPVSNFSASIAGQTAQLAVVAVILSWLSIVLYLWFRFGSARWGLAAVVCLIHDVTIVVGLVAASAWLSKTSVGHLLGIQSFKIDLAMIAAILTVIGYSVNDTIVVFDRIRENRGKLKTVSDQVINTSINQTLSRTLLTTGTTFIVVLIMYVMGGTGLHAFNYALLVGILFGTYSSVAVASPLLMGFRKAMIGAVTSPADPSRAQAQARAKAEAK
jgi:SecD/SecF fusion protein